MQETIILKDLIKEPLQENLQILFNHLGRYYYAIKKLNINENDIVLDIGCGQGYGSYLLSQYAFKVYGIDINNLFLLNAEKKFRVSGKINFLSYENFCSFSYNPNDINKIICIETIEHLKQENIPDFLYRFSRYYNLETFITFPIGENEPSKYNPYHKCEPSIEFIYNIIKKYFKKIEIEIDNFQNNYGYYQDYCIMVAK
jgi:cyclopropane fatty-acyl-phospholipid synthase-like methyltransferase